MFVLTPLSASRFVRAALLALPVLLAACTTPAPLTPPAAPPPPPPPAPVAVVVPVEVEPVAPATQPASLFGLITQGPVSSMLAFADKARALPAPELAAELARLGDPGDAPVTQMQVALLLAQTRVPADLARALGLLQRVVASTVPEAKPLQPLARTLSARYLEQRRVEDDRDRQAAQLRDAQRRIELLNDRLEALRAIERSFARPNNAPAPAAVNGARPAP